MTMKHPKERYNLANIQQNKLLNYSSSYSSGYGEVITDLPIIHNLPNLIAKMLPNNFRFVNLGSGAGKDSQLVRAACDAIGKKGEIINVDPYIFKDDIVNKTSEKFVQEAEDEQFDLMLLKYSLHFNKDHPKFFQNAKRVLKPDGRIIIHQMAKDTVLPWSEAIHDYNRWSSTFAEELIPEDLFDWEVIAEKKEVELNRQQFRDAIASRTWSNVLLATEQEIQECLDLIDNPAHSMKALLSKQQFIIRKKGVKP